jgi:hypothetical protein
MIVLELTDEEAMSLRGLLDTAVRAEGMRAASFALNIDAKIVNAAKAVQEQAVVTKSSNGGDLVAQQ